MNAQVVSGVAKLVPPENSGDPVEVVDPGKIFELNLSPWSADPIVVHNVRECQLVSNTCSFLECPIKK